MSLLPFKIGSTARGSREDRPSLMGGVLIGFITVWASSYMLGTILGDAGADRSEGGLWSLPNLAFFMVVETAVGLGAGFLAMRMDGPAVLGRLAAVLLFGGVVFAVMASDIPGSPVSGGSIFLKEVVHAAAVGALAYRFRGKQQPSDLRAIE